MIYDTKFHDTMGSVWVRTRALREKEYQQAWALGALRINWEVRRG